jgi:multisubunit Na+/H+ antiporter MnhE subunit
VQSFSKGHLIAGCVIGAACGLMLPLLLVSSMWFLPIPVIFAFLWVWAGWPSVLAGAASVALAGYLYWNLG